jgi:serralysin
MSANEHHYCVCLSAEDVNKTLPPEDKDRLAGHKAALLKSAKWPVGHSITLRFMGGTPELQERVKKVAREWTALANLTFDFRASGPTDIRIAFQQGNGSWSYLGTVCRDIREPAPTMNYGWLTPTSSDEQVRRVVLHEFGHAVGLIHEHQNPQGGIDWNRPAVIKDLSGPPNEWDLATIERNIFSKYAKTAVAATPVDAKSIMMYPIPQSWTNDGFSARLNDQLSETDKQFIRENYPG